MIIVIIIFNEIFNYYNTCFCCTHEHEAMDDKFTINENIFGEKMQDKNHFFMYSAPEAPIEVIEHILTSQ